MNTDFGVIILFVFSRLWGRLKVVSPLLNTFMVYGNDIAKEMLSANHDLVETLPPLYQNILSKSRKNRREGFCNILH